MLPSTNLQIQPAATGSRMQAIVNAIVEDLMRGQNVAAHTAALKAYGPSAAAGLLPHLHTSDATRRSIALYGLQHCWADDAREPLAALLSDNDPLVRHMASIVIAKHEGLGGLARLCEPLLDDPRPAIAGFAFERVEGEGPNLTRMLRFMRNPYMWDYVWKYLPRYCAPALTSATLRMLTTGNIEPALAAIAALIHQQKRSAAIREGMVGLLSHSLPEAREMAAEYLLWHGTAAETTVLHRVLQEETDAYARAAEEGALPAIARRDATIPAAAAAMRVGGSATVVLQVARAAAGLRERYEGALALLPDGAPPSNWKAAFDLYRTAEAFEPHWAYRDEDAPEDFAAERESRLALQARLFAIPAPAHGNAAHGTAASSGTHRGVFHAEPAVSLTPPVRSYADPKRESYGKLMEKDTEGFGGMVHIADDVGWHCDHRTVVAIGNGLVREVRCAATWGHLVVIEHELPDGERFCSLYAHLGPFVCVAPGEVVRRGQKIGAIGRSFTWENGGYIAHLHHGIHKGPFWKIYRPNELVDVRYEGTLCTGKVVAANEEVVAAEIHTPHGAYLVRKPATWVCGYVSKACWERQQHDWADPQEFLLSHAER